MKKLTLTPIGYIRTPYTSKYDAPRQPGSSRRRSTGTITLTAGQNFEQALEDLDGFDYVWVLFWFDRNNGWKPKVLPPAGPRKKRGLFSTRSPHRPNPIGLSLCRVLGVRGRTLKVENPDMLDGTPVIDIKPYIPHTEAKIDARSGWIFGTHEDDVCLYSVTISRNVMGHLSDIEPIDRKQIIAYVRSTLARDPFPHPYRRIKKMRAGVYRIAVRRWRFEYTLKGRAIRVIRGWAET